MTARYQRPQRAASTVANASRHSVVEAAHLLNRSVDSEYIADIAWDTKERLWNAWIKREGSNYVDFIATGTNPKAAAENLMRLYPQYFHV